MKNIFFVKRYTKCDRKASPRLIYKRSKFSITLDQQS